MELALDIQPLLELFADLHVVNQLNEICDPRVELVVYVVRPIFNSLNEQVFYWLYTSAPRRPDCIVKTRPDG